MQLWGKEKQENRFEVLTADAISVDIIHTEISEGFKIYGVQDELPILDC